jgi:hypothetical protein
MGFISAVAFVLLVMMPDFLLWLYAWLELELTYHGILIPLNRYSVIKSCQQGRQVSMI